MGHFENWEARLKKIREQKAEYFERMNDRSKNSTPGSTEILNTGHKFDIQINRLTHPHIMEIAFLHNYPHAKLNGAHGIIVGVDAGSTYSIDTRVFMTSLGELYWVREYSLYLCELPKEEVEDLKITLITTINLHRDQQGPLTKSNPTLKLLPHFTNSKSPLTPEEESKLCTTIDNLIDSFNKGEPYGWSL